MDHSLGLIKTKVARRLLGLFVISAFVPVLALAGVSFLAVSQQLGDQSRERLRQLSKNAGQSFLQQVYEVETGLRGLAFPGLEGDWPEIPSPAVPLGVVSLALQSDEGELHTLLGTPFEVSRISPDQRSSLDEGRMILTTQGRSEPTLLAAMAADPGRPGSGTLWALLQKDSIWAPALTFTSLPTVSEVCILDENRAPLFCRSGEAHFAQAFVAEDPGGVLGTFSHVVMDDDYIVGYWSFHPGGAFAAPPWTILVAESETSAFGPLEGFSFSFVMALLLGLSIVLLVSNVQIRQTLDPLSALEEGTKGIAHGDLTARVHVSTDDEFGALAGSFNRMAEHLEAQVTQLEVGRAMDRAVLDAFDRQEVVRAILTQVPLLVACSSARILVRGGAEREDTIIHLKEDSSELNVANVTLEKEELQWLAAPPQVGIAGGDVPDFLKRAGAKPGSGSLTVLPLLAKGELRGALILEVDGQQGLSESELEPVSRLADKAAVALDDVALLAELEDMSWGALRALARAIDAKSKWTAGHSERVTELALELGRRLGLTESELKTLNRGGLLHDVGKIGVPASILDNPGDLSEWERERIQQHPAIGARILEPIHAFGPALPIVLQHHERWDGRGYPAGLRGEEIHPLARILAVADVYDAMASPRPYRSSMASPDVLRFIAENKGTHFDPLVAEACLKHMAERGIFPAVASGRLDA
jgi:HAMP domain-containing protein